MPMGVDNLSLSMPRKHFMQGTGPCAIFNGLLNVTLNKLCAKRRPFL